MAFVKEFVNYLSCIRHLFKIDKSLLLSMKAAHFPTIQFLFKVEWTRYFQKINHLHPQLLVSHDEKNRNSKNTESKKTSQYIFIEKSFYFYFSPLCSWMSLSINIFQTLVLKLHIYLCRRNVRMSKHGLNCF